MADQSQLGGITFDSVQQQPAYWQLPLSQQNDVADGFFTKYVVSQNAYQQLAPEKQYQVRLGFNRKYNVGQAPPTYDSKDPVSNFIGNTLEAGDLATLGLPARAWDAAHYGASDTAETRDQGLQQYQNDPTWKGNFYRLSQNPLIKDLGGAVGAFHSSGQIFNALPENILGKVLPGLSSVAQKAITTAAGYSGLSNSVAVGQGKMNPIEALGQTGLAAATGGFAGNNRLLNALAQGSGGYIIGAGGNVLHDLTSGHMPDWRKANEEGMRSGLLGAGMGAAFHGADHRTEVPPQHQSSMKALSFTPMDHNISPPMKALSFTPTPMDHRQVAIDLHNTLQSPDVHTRMVAQQFKDALKRQAKDTYWENGEKKGTVKKPGNADSKQVLAEYEYYKKELAKGKRNAPGKRTIAGTSNQKQTYQNIINLGVKYRGQGGESAAKFENYLNKNFTPAEKKIINGKIKDIVEAAKKTETTGIERNKIAQAKKIEAFKKKNANLKEELRKQAEEEKEAAKALDKAWKEHEAQKARVERNKAALEKYRAAIEAKDARAAKEAKAEIDAAFKEHEQQKASEGRSKAALEKYRAAIEAKDVKAAKEAKAELEKLNKEKEKEIESHTEAAHKARIEENAGEAETLQGKTLRVLSPEEIETRSDQLLEHYKKGEAATLSDELGKHTVRAEITKAVKEGKITKERAEAVIESNNRVRDRFNQKKGELKEETRKPTAQEATKASEINRKELERVNENGGKYEEGREYGLQGRVKAGLLTWNQVKEVLDPESETYHKAEIIAEAMQKDGKVLIRYDAERSGDTGQFEYKTVSPIDFAFRNDKLVFHGINENGHIAEYYIDPSKVNEETGYQSYTHEAAILKRTFGKAKRGTYPNIEFGQREFKVADIMKRPARENAGYTSQTRLNYERAKKLLGAIETNKTSSKKIKVTAKSINEMAEKLESIQKMMNQDQVDVSSAEALKEELSKVQDRAEIVKESGC